MSHLTISPNPVYSDNCIVNFNLIENGNITFEILDLLGNLYFSCDAFYGIGEHSVSFDTKNIPIGTYTCRIAMNGKTIGTANFVIAK